MAQELGETVDEFARNLEEKVIPDAIEEVHKEKGWDEFWLVIGHKPNKMHPMTINEAIGATNVKPSHKILATMCIHVIYSKGLKEYDWVLPLDYGNALREYDSDTYSEGVFNDAKSLGTGILT